MEQIQQDFEAWVQDNYRSNWPIEALQAAYFAAAARYAPKEIGPLELNELATKLAATIVCGGVDGHVPMYTTETLDLLRELTARLPKEGEVIVPVEPTEAMIEVGWSKTMIECGISDIYRAMISAYKRDGENDQDEPSNELVRDDGPYGMGA